jgi:hypothetical protein
MRNRTRKLRWVVPLAIVGAAGLAACGDEDATRTTAGAAVAVADVAGSDVHLANQAAELRAERANRAASERLAGQADARHAATVAAAAGSDMHLANQAAEIASRETTSLGSDVHLANLAADVEKRAAATSSGTTTNPAAEDAERSAHLDGQASTHGT